MKKLFLILVAAIIYSTTTSAQVSETVVDFN